MRDKKAVEAWIEGVVEKYGRLDGAVNLAGVIGRQIGVANIEDIEDEDWDFVMGVNLMGTLNCLRAEIKGMKRLRKGGSIVNVSLISFGNEGNRIWSVM